MLKRRIIPCLDVKAGKVIKGVKFQQHQIVGDILPLAKYYSEQGADELVFYDITASTQKRLVDKKWVKAIAKLINIPFCVAGGINSVKDAAAILANGADKISINSPAIKNPPLITRLAQRFGKQCVVVGIDSYESDGEYYVYQYTGDQKTIKNTGLKTIDWAKRVVELGAGEIVLNCMNCDGVRKGYDLKQIKLISDAVSVPVIGSGGAGSITDFEKIFRKTRATGALAASVFHKQIITIPQLKQNLKKAKVEVRIC